MEEHVGVEQRAKQQIEADGGAQKFGEIGGNGSNFGGEPEADRNQHRKDAEERLVRCLAARGQSA